MTALPSNVDVEHFLNNATGPIFDVRSPCEYASGHIPGSYLLALFSDEERAIIGTIYKQKGHDAAVQAGLQVVGPKLGLMAAQARTIIQTEKASSCRVTCFRGGMRSRSVQWLCELIGFPTVRLEGGYKVFRRFVLETFDRPFKFIVIGGPTGSGKTGFLSVLKEKGFQVLDLETIAKHRGSAFGLLPGVVQPTTEQFENLLADQLRKMDQSLPIFVEDESLKIGACALPIGMYNQMDKSELIWLQVSVEERLQHILQSYGFLPCSWLVACTKKLEKRLGNERTQTIVDFIEQGSIKEAAKMLLEYYDHAYLHSRSRRGRPYRLLTPDEFRAEIDSGSILKKE